MIILSDLFNKVKKRISMRKKRKIYEEFFKQNIMKFNFFQIQIIIIIINLIYLLKTNANVQAFSIIHSLKILQKYNNKK